MSALICLLHAMIESLIFFTGHERFKNKNSHEGPNDDCFQMHLSPRVLKLRQNKKQISKADNVTLLLALAMLLNMLILGVKNDIEDGSHLVPFRQIYENIS